MPKNLRKKTRGVFIIISIRYVIKPSNKLYISRISQNRGCKNLYLNSKKLVDKVIDNNVTVKIKNHANKNRHSFTNNKRIY